MDIKEFHERISALAKKEGKPLLGEKEVFGKTAEQFKQMSENNYDGFKEAWTQKLDYYNNTLNIIYGLAIGIFSAVFMQSIFEVLKIIIKKELYFFVFTFLAIISLFILITISFILFKSMKQVNIHMKRDLKGMRESLKVKRDSEKMLKDLNKIS